METTVADYIVIRLRALGIKHLFQVPGNYTSDFLRAAYASGDLLCVSTTNEMEAGYAADAYARLHGIGVLCVTLGVGSLSAYNAMAGSYVEFCPVLMINGSANKKKVEQMISQGVLFAHAIDEQRTDEALLRPVTVATAVITRGEEAPAAIDRVIRTMITEGRPVYLEVADGVWTERCAAPADPDVPLQAYPPSERQQADQEIATLAAARAIVERLRAAKKPVLWGGEGVQRIRAEADFRRLVEITGLPYTTTLMGKGLIPESTTGFLGVYDSVFAPREVRDVVEGSDLLIAFGTILGDFYGKIIGQHFDRMILAAGNAVRIGSARYPNVPLARLLPVLLEELAKDPADGFGTPAGYEELVAWRQTRAEDEQAVAAQGMAAFAAGNIGDGAGASNTPADDLRWDSFFSRLRGFVQPEMLVVVDTSMALFPSSEIPIHRERHFIAQTVWLSIGYTTGAALGASFALPKGERVLAIAGDGGFQMLPQMLSTLVRYKIPAIILVCDNKLYAVEQFLIDATYFADPGKPPVFFNELPDWDYEALAHAFGAWGRSATTLAELDEALAGALANTNGPSLIAVKLPAKDMPSELRPAPSAAAAGFAGDAEVRGSDTVNKAAFN